MASAAATNDREAAWKKLLKKCEWIDDTTAVGACFKNAALSALMQNVPGAELSPEEIAGDILALLPKIQDILTPEFIARPSYPILVVKRVADFYGCMKIPQELLDLLDDDSKGNSDAMLYAWISYSMNPVTETVTRALDLYWPTQYPNLTASPDETVRDQVRGSSPHTDASPRTPPAGANKGVECLVFPPQGANRATTPAGGSNNAALNDPAAISTNTGFGLSGINPNQASRPFPAGDVRISTAVPSHATGSMNPESHRKAAAVNSYFRDSKFTGMKEQSIHRTVRDFNVCAMQYELTLEQKRIFFVNAFGGSARDYFFENCRDDMDFEALAKVMVDEYDSDARQLAVHSELDRLSLDRVMKDQQIVDLDAGLTLLVDRINVLTPQCPPNFRSDGNKVRFLRNSVLRQEWAQPAISQITTSRFNYNGLVTALREQLQLSEEKKELSGPSDTFYQQYGRNPKTLRQNPTRDRIYDRIHGGKNSSSRKNPIGRDGKRMLCHLCQSDGHFASDCSVGDFKRTVADKMRSGTSAVHILSEIASHLEVDAVQEREEDGHILEHESELDTFNKLVDDQGHEETTTAVVTSFNNAQDQAKATHHVSSVLDQATAVDPLLNWDASNNSLFQ